MLALLFGCNRSAVQGADAGYGGANDAAPVGPAMHDDDFAEASDAGSGSEERIDAALTPDAAGSPAASPDASVFHDAAAFDDAAAPGIGGGGAGPGVGDAGIDSGVEQPDASLPNAGAGGLAVGGGNQGGAAGVGGGGSDAGGAGSGGTSAGGSAGSGAAGGSGSSGANGGGGTGFGGGIQAGGAGPIDAGPVDPGPPGTIQVDAVLASQVDEDAPTTVGIVTFSIVESTVLSAVIEFGLDTTYGTTVPVDLEQPDYRTLLLGMKPGRTYHFRVVVQTTAGAYQSDDQELATDVVRTSVTSRFEVLDGNLREPGFILGSFWRGQGAKVFILDGDGDLVWVMPSPAPGIARATFAADGKSLWAVSTNNSGGPVYWMSLDGLEVRGYDVIGSHDITAVSDDVIAFIDYGEQDCDSVFEMNSEGAVVEVFELSDYLTKGATLSCHGNALRYSPSWDSYIVSSLLEDVFIVPRDGSTVRRLSQIVPGGNETWGRTQHGVHFLGDSLLLFANDEGDVDGGFQSGGPSTVLEYSLIDGSELWRFESSNYSANLGDAQRLPGGNTLVTYSNDLLIQEVTLSGQIVLEIRSSGSPFGYTTWRESLYEPPVDLSAVDP